MSAKAAYPVTRKNCMYEYSISLKRYRQLQNRFHAACFLAAQSAEATERLNMLLDAEFNRKESFSGHKERMRYGPVLPQTAQLDSGDLGKVLDPVRVQGRGAPKKRLQAKMKKARSKGKCGYCKEHGHNRRTCRKLQEVAIL